MIDSVWRSPEGREISWRRRRMRTRYLRIEGEPEQKARRGSRYRAAQTQRDLADQLWELDQHPLTGPVAVDVEFYVSRREPPSVHNLAKHLLDVLGAVQPQVAAPNRRHLLYRDDRQVKLIHVRLWKPSTTNAPVSSGHTTICARPLRDVAADLALVHALEDLSGTTLAADDDSGRYWHPIPAPVFDIPRAASTEHADGWFAMNGWLAAYDHAQLQAQVLAGTDAFLTRVLAGAPHWVAGVRGPSRRYADDAAFTDIYAMLDESAASRREMLLSSPLTAPMPGLPRASGEGRAFKAAVRKAVELMADKVPVLAPLRVPLKVVLLVIPPQQGKDLDNLALTVLPAVQDILSAPVITAYEVIELKRTDADPAAGRLRFALASGSQDGSTWQRATDYVARLMEFA